MTILRRAIDWPNTACLAHHAQFDGLILSHHYGSSPPCGSTLSPWLRAVLDPSIGKGLGSWRTYSDYPLKAFHTTCSRGNTGMISIPGRVVRLQPDAVTTWNLHGICFVYLPGNFLPTNTGWSDETVRLFTEPVLVGNAPFLLRSIRKKGKPRVHF